MLRGEIDVLPVPRRHGERRIIDSQRACPAETYPSIFARRTPSSW